MKMRRPHMVVAGISALLFAAATMLASANGADTQGPSIAPIVVDREIDAAPPTSPDASGTALPPTAAATSPPTVAERPKAGAQMTEKRDSARDEDDEDDEEDRENVRRKVRDEEPDEEDDD